MESGFRKNALRCVFTASVATGIGLAAAGSASAHMGIDLRGASQMAGMSSVIFFRPGHGCAGDATNTLSVTIPNGVTAAKAQQKVGWQLTAKADTFTWSGGSLPDDQFDDFGIKLTWPKLAAGVTSQPLYFKTIQTCAAELKVTRAGNEATITGQLPGFAGKRVHLFVDSVPLTRHAVAVDADGGLMLKTTSTKLPDGSQVTAELNGHQVANSIAGVEAWIDIPVAGSNATLASPAPSVVVVA